MKKLVVSLLLAFALVGGAATISAIAPNPAYADGSGNGGGGH
jgi:hypothetical protein